MSEENKFFIGCCVRNDSGLDIQFMGMELAVVSSEHSEAAEWTELRVHETENGRFVFSKSFIKRNFPDSNKFEAIVQPQLEGCISFFGYGWLAKNLYEKIGVKGFLDLD